MDEASARAAYAADSVRALFGRRLLGLPGTYLPHVVHPGPRRWAGPWHYWWLAHVIDGLVDEAQREQRWGRSDRAATATTLADRLLRSIRLRNLGRFTNHYYDDMGWLLLAAQRLNALLAEAGPHAGTRTRRLSLQAGRVLRPAVLRGHTAELGGGVFWNDHHDFKNAPATGPAAIFLARIGETTQARALLDWMDDHLRDPDTGLVIDGIRVAPDGTQTLVRDIYTYNQGTVLGGLVELAERGDHECAARAETLVAAVAAHCAAPAAT
ncbi:MAG: glycoside hydrolase family 76 protein, partial [Candidatus Phosphoribacter sp.]